MFPSAKEVQAKALRDATEAGLALCTPKEVAFFNKIHDQAPWKGWANCPDEKLVESYELVRRTVMKGETL